MEGRVASAATSANGRGGDGRATAELHERLQARKPEIEQAILTRVYAIADPTEVSDPAYAEGLRAAVSAAIDYSLEGIGSSERNPPPIPPVLLVQARVAARSRVGLDTVLRRCFSGHALFVDFLVGEAQKKVQGTAFKRLLRSQTRIFDRLIAAMSEEHGRDAKIGVNTGARRRLDLVQRLLDGEPLDASELSYDFEGSHVALVANGAGAAEAVRSLARALDSRLLLVCPDEYAAWAWLAASRVDLDEVASSLDATSSPELTLAVGERGQGLAGWRFSHRQARAAFQIALRGPEALVRYADVAMLASVLRDDLLAGSLRQLYLVPLEREKDGGRSARETLQAYLTTGRNITSAAAVLGVNRDTVTNRLRAAEEAIGRPLDAWVAEFGTVLALERLRPGHP